MDLKQDIPSLKAKLCDAMLVGMDVSHDKKQREAYGRNSSGSCVGFVATYDKQLTKYYAKIAYQGKREEIVNSGLELMVSALDNYKNFNKQYPQRVIVYRDGVGDSQIETFVEREIQLYRRAFQKLEITPKLTIVLVLKMVNHRIFSKKGQYYDSLDIGTCVDTGIISPKFKEFFLITTKAPPGASARPVRYIIAEDDANFTADEIQNLTHKLCYMYQNWNGPIRVPAPVMNAHKLAYIYGKLVNIGNDGDGSLHPDLQTKLHYL